MITVFWFLLFINAVNLIDGLDGLAGGVVLFTCLLMVVLSVMTKNYLNGMYFAALGGALILARKTGYLECLALDKFYGWFRYVRDAAGFSRERRTFLALQLDANQTRTLEELWVQVGEALEMLKFDRAELHLKSGAAPRQPESQPQTQPEPAVMGSLSNQDNPSPAPAPLAGGEQQRPHRAEAARPYLRAKRSSGPLLTVHRPRPRRTRRRCFRIYSNKAIKPSGSGRATAASASRISPGKRCSRSRFPSL